MSMRLWMSTSLSKCRPMSKYLCLSKREGASKRQSWMRCPQQWTSKCHCLSSNLLRSNCQPCLCWLRSWTVELAHLPHCNAPETNCQSGVGQYLDSHHRLIDNSTRSACTGASSQGRHQSCRRQPTGNSHGKNHSLAHRTIPGMHLPTQGPEYSCSSACTPPLRPWWWWSW